MPHGPLWSGPPTESGMAGGDHPARGRSSRARDTSGGNWATNHPTAKAAITIRKTAMRERIRV